MQNLKTAIAKGWKYAAISALSAIVTAFLTFSIEWKQETRIDNNTLLVNLQKENERLSEENAEYRKYQITYIEKVAGLQNELLMHQSATISNPLPMWIKSVGTATEPGKMLAVNEAFEDLYLRPIGRRATEYIGLSDRDFWGSEIGDSYWAQDLEVIYSGEIADVTANHPFKKKNGVPIQLRVIKYPRYFGRTMIGVAGVAIPTKKLK